MNRLKAYGLTALVAAGLGIGTGMYDSQRKENSINNKTIEVAQIRPLNNANDKRDFTIDNTSCYAIWSLDNREEVHIYVNNKLEALLIDVDCDNKVDVAYLNKPQTCVNLTNQEFYPKDITKEEIKIFMDCANELFRVTKEELNVK